MTAPVGRRSRLALSAPAAAASAGQLKSSRQCRPPGPKATDRRGSRRGYHGVAAWEPPRIEGSNLLLVTTFVNSHYENVTAPGFAAPDSKAAPVHRRQHPGCTGAGADARRAE